MDLTPENHMLNGLRQQNIKHSVLIAELIDNSLDANAQRVEIAFGPGKRFQITDDGIGCNDIEAMLTLGKRQSHASTRLGRYGIGFKDAALYLWGTTTIETIHRGVLRRANLNWPELAKLSTWKTDDPTEEDAGNRIGTSITFSSISRHFSQTPQLLEELGFIFSPAILAGKQIIISSSGKRLPCVAYKLPPMSDVVDESFAIEGRGVRLFAGIVLDGHPNKRDGFTLQHGHRSLRNTGLGAGEFSTSRIAGIIELDNKWALTKNKDDITEFEDDLGNEIYKRCENILRKADLHASRLESTALADAISERLTAAIKSLGTIKHRESRNHPSNKTGSVKPVGTGRTRRNAEKTTDLEGSVERAARGGLRVEWSDSSGKAIGDADLPGRRIKLNANNEFLARLRKEENADALAILAFGIYVDAVRETNGHQKYLPYMDPAPFVETWGNVLSGMPVEAKKARAAP